MLRSAYPHATVGSVIQSFWVVRSHSASAWTWGLPSKANVILLNIFVHAFCNLQAHVLGDGDFKAWL